MQAPGSSVSTMHVRQCHAYLCMVRRPAWVTVEAARACWCVHVVCFTGGHKQALLDSWEHFKPRAARLQKQLDGVREAAQETARALHEAALHRAQQLLKGLPVPEAMATEAGCQTLLLYVYVSVGAIAARLGWLFLRNCLYA